MHPAPDPPLMFSADDPTDHTVLDQDETNVGLLLPASSRDFRHGFWRHRRSRILEALDRTNVPPAVRQRFEDCGSCAWVVRAREQPDLIRIHSKTCRSRWCEACSLERRVVVSRNVREQCIGKQVRFCTLTLRSRPGPLAEQVQRLYRCFKNWRNRKKIKQKVFGGIAFLEVTRSDKTGLWHPHLHVLFEGRYLPHTLASEEWLLVTKDSYVVHITRVPNHEDAARYVTKYASKGLCSSIWRQPALLDECIVALRGTRTFTTFGTWRGVRITFDRQNDYTWDEVCTLDRLFDRARCGDKEARRLVALLRVVPGVSVKDPDRELFAPSQVDPDNPVRPP